MKTCRTITINLKVEIPVIEHDDDGDFYQPPQTNYWLDDDEPIMVSNVETFDKFNLDDLQEHIKEYVRDYE